MARRTAREVKENPKKVRSVRVLQKDLEKIIKNYGSLQLFIDSIIESI